MTIPHGTTRNNPMQPDGALSSTDLLQSQIRRARERAADFERGSPQLLEQCANEWQIRMGLPCPSWCDLPEGHDPSIIRTTGRI